MLSLLGVITGIAILIGGGALLVRGASDIAADFGVPPMIVGLTIVGFGTSSPELFINVFGAMSGATDIAFGNVVGSNISNLALVLGAVALFHPIRIRGEFVRREIPLLLLVTTMITVMALDQMLEGVPPVIDRADALILLLMFLIFLYISALDLLLVKEKDPLLTDIHTSPMVPVPSPAVRLPALLPWVFTLAGLGLLFVGGELTIRNGVVLAEQLNVSGAIVGLLVVAVGTSMPELVTSIIAAFRKESDLALGNVIGSNLFNSLMVLPVSGTIATIPVPEGGVIDLIVSMLLTAALVPLFFFGKALGRKTGIVFLGGYIAYAIWRLIGASA